MLLIKNGRVIDPAAGIDAALDVLIDKGAIVKVGGVTTVMVTDWARDADSGLVAVPFDPPLNFPTDLVSRWPASEEVTELVQSALRVRDSEGWLTERPPRTELPED